MEYENKYLKYKLKYFDLKYSIIGGGSACTNTIYKKNIIKYQIDYCINKDLTIIAHRGAQGYLPEHTLEAYDLAIRLGADFIELDIMSTSDGVLVIMHDIDLANTTDIAEHSEFADRKVIQDHNKKMGWPINNFTLEEIKTLRCKQRSTYSKRSMIFDGIFRIPTLDEVLVFVKDMKTIYDLPIGLYIETKHPRYFCKNNLSIEHTLIETLKKHDLLHTNHLYIQSFDDISLQRIKHLGTDIPLIQIFRSKTLPDDQTLRKVKSYAYGISLNKKHVLKYDEKTNKFISTDIVQNAKSIGLAVHTWTVRNESVNTEHFGKIPKGTVNEIISLYNNGINTIITDNPDSAVRARDLIQQKQYLLGTCV